MIELGFMIQEYYENACADLTGGVNGYVDAILLWFVRFYKYAVITKGLGLKQSKVNLCVFFRRYEKSKNKIMVIF